MVRLHPFGGCLHDPYNLILHCLVAIHQCLQLTKRSPDLVARAPVDAEAAAMSDASGNVVDFNTANVYQGTS